ncbi:MAG: HD domain-containing protein [Actinomycetota bacterium]|nr:HD domain-containing protein [Actinomycetota bacterium]
MPGYRGGEGIRLAHPGSGVAVGAFEVAGREDREAWEDGELAPGATRASGAGERSVQEEPDPWRTCFERDRDRILHASAFRRLAGKTQVFVFPADFQRTRLTHALEVAQVATAISRACRLNVALTEAIALGHDCGHGPGGHASEEALSPYLDCGFDHATWGADVTLAPLNLCRETVDGVRNHSWSRPAPSTPEGEVVALADRIAYSAHDFEDAVHSGVVDPSDLPSDVAAWCGARRPEQLRAFVADVVLSTRARGSVCMSEQAGSALSRLRAFNYDRIYMRAASVEQSRSVIALLGALVSYYLEQPSARLGQASDEVMAISGEGERVRAVVAYVAGMTDRFACTKAVELLGWPRHRLPNGFDVPRDY